MYLILLILTVACVENPVEPGDNDPLNTLCYIKLINQSWEIVLNDLENDSVKNISNNPAGNYSPEWSPDGKSLK